ncbi:hypothetical protein JOQ06_007887 [Pogonophryne albipinna]|uniref:Uncharacterized protein n=1 Tax=Pogonophryne albipinna TaxID=1090488 RepID=A0AAD6AA01_9TELE|nr:hypothetical protein JOQ06_007887 [Pogonophryne albipinna]
MDLKALETKWRTALSSILDELTGDEFRKLLFNLEKIPQGLKEGRPRGDMPSVIIQYYGTEGSITLMDRLMRNLPRRDAAVQQPLRGIKGELKKLREKSKATTSKQSDSGAATMKKKPVAAATSKQTNGSGAVTEKKKPAAGTKPAADSGAATKKKKPADQSAAPLQTRKIKVITLLRTTKTSAHLQNMQGKRILEMRTI